MRITLLSIVLFVSVSSLNGQNPRLDGYLKIAMEQRLTLDSALHYSNLAFQLALEIKEPLAIAKSKVCSAVAYYIASQRDTAVNLLYDALPHLEGSPFYKGMALWYLGKAHVYSNDFESGEEKYLKAIKAFDQVDSLEYSAHALTGIGIIYGMQAKYSEALDWFIKSYELRLSMGAESETSNDLANISSVYMWMGNYEMALKFAWKSVNISQDDDDSGTILNIGGIFNNQGLVDSAEYYYQKGFDMASLVNNQYTMRNGLLNLANISHQRGEYRKAIHLLNQALLLQGSRDQSMFGLLTELGKNYQQLGILDSATYCLTEGLKLARESGNVRIGLEASEYLGQLYAQRKQFDSAYHFISLSKDYKDSLNNDRIQEIFANQRVKIETLDKEFEIDQLQKDAALRQSEKETIMVLGASGLIILMLIFFNYRGRMRLKQRTLQAEKADLADELEQNKALLSAHTLSMIHRKNGFEEIEAQLDNVDGSGKQKIRGIISVNKALEKDWENFQTYFGQVHARYFEDLKAKHADLTQSEVRLSALIKMDLANREIASLLNIEPKSVKMAKYRLKKKLNLPEDDHLNDYLQNLKSH